MESCGVPAYRCRCDTAKNADPVNELRAIPDAFARMDLFAINAIGIFLIPKTKTDRHGDWLASIALDDRQATVMSLKHFPSGRNRPNDTKLLQIQYLEQLPVNRIDSIRSESALEEKRFGCLRSKRAPC
ncbi:MAG: hypothetical protein QNJ43_13105 [Breoghania sp.]|nr:hypothetical protein [Breoghania sp.]